MTAPLMSNTAWYGVPVAGVASTTSEFAASRVKLRVARPLPVGASGAEPDAFGRAAPPPEQAASAVSAATASARVMCRVMLVLSRFDGDAGSGDGDADLRLAVRGVADGDRAGSDGDRRHGERAVRADR